MKNNSSNKKYQKTIFSKKNGCHFSLIAILDRGTTQVCLHPPKSLSSNIKICHTKIITFIIVNLDPKKLKCIKVHYETTTNTTIYSN